MTLVATYPDRGKARSAQTTLENAGIPSTLVDAGASPYSQGTPAMRLLVIPQYGDKAKATLGIARPRKALGMLASAVMLCAVVLLAVLKPH